MPRSMYLQGVALEVRKLRTLLPAASGSRAVNRSSRVQVLCRFRGQSEAERQRGGSDAWDLAGCTVTNADDTQASTPFSFDYVLGPDATQVEAYESVEPVVRTVLHGGNAAVLCYGQTSAGKTFTMEGHAGEHGQGIIPRTLSTLMGAATGAGGRRDSFHMSMFEIYNERLRDLLDPESSAELKIMEDSHGVTVHGLHEVPVTNCQHALDTFHHGQQHRKVAETGMNDRSSRSHSIFVLKVMDGDNQVVGKLCLVDLAGSECVEKARCHGEGAAEKNAAILEEAKAINQSLSTLGLVIARLAGRKNSGGSRSSDAHVPYRSSKLTRALQDTLGGNSRTLLVINCSVSSLQIPETLSTLRFGSRARTVENVISTVASGDVMLATLRSARLEILRLRQLGATGLSPHAFPCFDEPMTSRTLPASPSKRRHPGPMLETHSEGDSLSLISGISPRSNIASRRVSRSLPAPSGRASAPESRERSLSPLALSLQGSRRQSRRVSVVSRGSLGASEGPPVSPLSLSPRSAAASRKASRRNSGVVRWSTGTDGCSQDLELSKTSLDVPPGSPRDLIGLPTREGGEAPTGQETLQRRYGVRSWEFPLTRQETTIRVAMDEVPERAADQPNEDVVEQLRRLVEERDALQAENELLHAEKADYVEQAVRGSWSRLLEDSPMMKFNDAPSTPKPTPAEKPRSIGVFSDSPLDSGEQDKMQEHSNERRLQQELEEVRVQHKQELEQLRRQLVERDAARVTAQLEGERAAHAEELQTEQQRRLQLAENIDLEKEKHAAELQRVEEGFGQQLQVELTGRAADLQIYEEQREQWLLERQEIQRVEAAREEELADEVEGSKPKHVAEMRRVREEIVAEQAKTLEVQLELQRLQAAVSNSSSTRSRCICSVFGATLLILAGASLGVALSMANIMDHGFHGARGQSEVVLPVRSDEATLGFDQLELIACGDCVHATGFAIERAECLPQVTVIEFDTAHAHRLPHRTVIHTPLENGSKSAPSSEEAVPCELADVIGDATIVEQVVTSNASLDDLGSVGKDEELFYVPGKELRDVRVAGEEEVAAEREEAPLDWPMDTLEEAGVRERELNVLKALAYATGAAFTTVAGHIR